MRLAHLGSIMRVFFPFSPKKTKFTAVKWVKLIKSPDVIRHSSTNHPDCPPGILPKDFCSWTGKYSQESAGIAGSKSSICLHRALRSGDPSGPGTSFSYPRRCGQPESEMVL